MSLDRDQWRRHCRAVGGILLGALLVLLRLTWRIRVEGRVRPGCLHAFWHGDQVALGGALAGAAVTVLVSRSRDGELAARAARVLGFGVARGSSHRGAVPGALALLRALRAGHAVGLAVDGPRGPRHCCRRGAERLARLAGTVVVPVGAAAGQGLTLRSWDRLRLPAPFARVQVVVGEKLRNETLEQSLARATARAERLACSPRAGRLAPALLFVLALVLLLAGCRLGREQARRDLQSPEPAVRAEALRRLGEAGDRSLGELVAAHLKDSSPRVRRAAVAALGALGLGSGKRHLLVERLHDADLEVRLGAVRVLGDSGDPRAQEALLEALDDGSPLVRRAAGLALRALGLDGPAQARRRAGRELAAQVKRLAHADEQVAASAAQLLGLSGRAEAVEPLLQRLVTAQRAPLLGREVVAALGRLGGAHARHRLEQVLASETPALRAAAAEAWVAGGGDPARLVGLTRDPEPEVRRAALAGLLAAASLPGRAVSSACSALVDEDDAVAREAARLVRLRSLRCEEVRQVLRPVGGAAALRWRVVAELPGDEAATVLVRLAGQRAAEYREEAGRWVPAERWTELGRSGGEPELDGSPAWPPARRLDPGKRAALERLLRRFPEPEADEDEDPLLPPATDAADLLELLETLAGRPGAGELLLALASDPGPVRLRAAALRALVTPRPGSRAGANSRPTEALARVRALVAEALGAQTAPLRRAAAEGCSLLEVTQAAAAADQLLRSPQFELRAAGARCLAAVRGKRAVPRLLELLEEEPHLGLLETLASLGDRRAVEPLLRLLVASDQGSPEDRLPVIEALGALADSRAAPLLEQELGHPDGRVRRAAAEALGRAGRRASAEVLAACSEDFLADVRAACRAARRQTGRP